jgi:hypothetical protein
MLVEPPEGESLRHTVSVDTICATDAGAMVIPSRLEI